VTQRSELGLEEILQGGEEIREKAMTGCTFG